MSTIPAVSERIVMCTQGDAEWFQCRLGAVTSSRVADAIAKRKRITAGKEPEELACRRDMKYELMLERLTGKATEHYVSRWMKEGKEKEPLARDEYSMANDWIAVEQVGYVYHPTIKWAGASPDGLIAHDGLLEIKCPAIYTHLDYLLANVVPEEYQPQMLWQMACAEREWCDFVSYSPDMPDKDQLFIKRFYRNDAIIRGMELEVTFFLEQVEELLTRLKQRNAQEIGQ